MDRLSRFVHVFDSGKKHIALYHSIKLMPIFLDRSYKDMINSWRNGIQRDQLSSDEAEIFSELKKVGIVTNGQQDDFSLSEVREQLKPSLSVMYLILTDRCNLRCKYCFIEAGFPEEYKCMDMTWNVAKASIDYFIKNRSSGLNCQLWFYGGEPFINKELLFKCLDYINIHDSEIIPMLISNGTLITKDDAKKLCCYEKLQVSISLDGSKEIDDSMRIDSSENGSYDRAMSGIRNLQAAGKSFGISCTLAEHNVDNVVDIAKWIKEYVGTPNIGMNLLVDTPKKFVDEEYVAKANRGLLDFFSEFRNEEAFESRILRKVRAFVERKPRWHDCSACGNQIVIAPDGAIGICHEGLGEKKFFVGNILDEFSFNNDSNIKEWANRSPINMPQCLDCEALGMCGGGCPYGAMLRYGSMWEVDKRFCVHSKGSLEWLIWDLYDKIKLRLSY